MEFAVCEPSMYQFLFIVFLNSPESLNKELSSRITGYAKTSHKLMQRDLDISKFKNGSNIEKAIQLIEISIEGLLNKHLPEMIAVGPGKSLDLINEIQREIEVFFELLKRGLYK